MKYPSHSIYDENVAIWLFRGRNDPPPNPWDDGAYPDDPGPFFGDVDPVPSDLASDIWLWLRCGGARVMFEDWFADAPQHPLEWAGEHRATTIARERYAKYLQG